MEKVTTPAKAAAPAKRGNPILNKKILYVVLIVIGLIIPYVLKTPYTQQIFILIFLYAASAGAWNIIGGYGGQVSLGHVAFFGIGAYTTALLYNSFALTPWIGMIIGAVLAAIIAGLISYPCFRLRGPFFTLATLAFAEVLRLLCVWARPVTGGQVGVTILFKPGFANMQFFGKAPYYYISFILMLLIFFISLYIERSKFGYYLTALKEDHDAAEALGINTARCKLYATVISGFLTAICGAFYTQLLLFIEPNSVFASNLVEPVCDDGGGRGSGDSHRAHHRLLHPDTFERTFEGRPGRLFPGAELRDLRPDPDPCRNLHAQRDRGLLQGRQQEAVEKGGEKMLEVNKICKHFAGLRAVNDVSFTIEKGEIMGLIGPNGAGKTTIFNMIDATYPLTSGEIHFNGRLISRLSRPSDVCKTGIGRTFQVVKPFGGMTVLENVMVGAFNVTNSVGQAREKAQAALEMVGLLHNEGMLARNLTVSDRKRLEVARALATEPQLLLLDEVMAGLNPTEVEEIIPLIRKIRDQGVTIFMIEHIMASMMKLSDRILVLHHGEKLAEGTPAEVTSNEKVIAAYLGGHHNA